jgi:hypothetical protein
MIPSFDTASKMLYYFRELTPGTNFKVLLEDEGFDVTGFKKYEYEYLWKYLVQGTKKGYSGQALNDYAKAGTFKVCREYHVELKEGNQTAEAPTDSNRPGPKSSAKKFPDGTIVKNEKLNKFDGYVGGKVVSRAGSIEKVKNCLTKNYSIIEFNAV